MFANNNFRPMGAARSLIRSKVEVGIAMETWPEVVTLEQDDDSS